MELSICLTADHWTLYAYKIDNWAPCILISRSLSYMCTRITSFHSPKTELCRHIYLVRTLLGLQNASHCASQPPCYHIWASIVYVKLLSVQVIIYYMLSIIRRSTDHAICPLWNPYVCYCVIRLKLSRGAAQIQCRCMAVIHCLIWQMILD